MELKETFTYNPNVVGNTPREEACKRNVQKSIKYKVDKENNMSFSLFHSLCFLVLIKIIAK